MSRARRELLAFNVLLLLIAFGLRLHRLGGPSLWYDELLQLDIAQGPLVEIGPALIRHAAMPLDYLLLHGWLRLGRQELWVRFPALVFGVLSVALTYALAKRLFQPRVAVIAAALLAWAYLAVRYSQEARPYSLLLFFTLLSFLGLWQAHRRHQHRYWLLAIVGLSGAALSHYFAIFLLAPFGLFVGFNQLFHLADRRYWLHTLLLGLAGLILFLLFILTGRIWYLYSVGERFSREMTRPELYTLPAVEKPNRGSGPPISRDFFVEQLLMPLASVEPKALLIYNAFLLVALLALAKYRQEKRAALLLLLFWLLLPIGLIYLFLLHRGTFFAIRYILYTIPAYLMLAAYGLDAAACKLVAIRSLPNLPLSGGGTKSFLRPTSAPALIAALLLAPLLLSQGRSLAAHYRAEPYEDWRAVGRLLHQEAAPGDAVIAVNAEPALNWYYPPASAPFKTYQRSEVIWQALRSQPRRWFVLSSYSVRQDQGLRAWLREQQAVVIAIDRRIVVYYHQAGKSGAELLAEVKNFALPPLAITYAALADQLAQHGDLEASRRFYQRALTLAQTPAQQAEYQTRLAALSSLK